MYVSKRPNLPTLLDGGGRVAVRGRAGKLGAKDFCVSVNSGYSASFNILQHVLFAYLEQEGFYSHRTDVNSYDVYKVDDGIASRVDVADVIRYIIDNAFHERRVHRSTGEVTLRLNNKYKMHYERFFSNPNRYFGASKVSLLKELSADLLRDTKDRSYFFYLNGVVVVTADDIKLQTYEKTLGKGKIVLADSIKKREVEIVDRDVALESDFSVFMTRAVTDEGVSSLRRSMGYMMHRHKDPARAKMVFYSDAERSEGIAFGRTGKSLCAKVALSQMRNVSVVDGKQFSSSDRFMLDGVDPSADIISFQDMRKAFDKEALYNMITGDLQINQKYKSVRTIPFELSPKLIADSNYGISLLGSSDLARINVVGFDNYYNDLHQPRDDFGGRTFFSEWSPEQWHEFDTLMFMCVQEYLQLGLKNHRLDDMVSNNLYTRYPADLVDMIKDNRDILLHKNTPETWFDHIPYWKDDNYTKRREKIAIISTIMKESGFTRYANKRSVRIMDEVTGEERQTSEYVYWFEE